VALAEHNNVVKAFPADRTDQPFSISNKILLVVGGVSPTACPPMAASAGWVLAEIGHSPNPNRPWNNWNRGYVAREPDAFSCPRRPMK
jgi:hypothetical protein